MDKYIVNGLVHGYEKIMDIDSLDMSKIQESEIVLIIDKACDVKLGSYYKFVSKALKNRNRVLLLSLRDDNKSFKPLASLMTTFNAYDIYIIEDKDVTAKALDVMEKRCPDFSEVQTYIGGIVTSYSDMTTILYGIESLVDEGNDDKLREFLEEHLASIENFTTSLNIMKKTCDVFNSTELIDEVNTLKEKETKLRNSLDEKIKLITQVEKDKEDLKNNIESYKASNTRLQNQLDTLKSQESDNSGAVIKNVNTIQTSLIQCKTKVIIYFREISYVTHVNSLILHFMSFIENLKFRVKLMIYDDRVGISNLYGNLAVVSSSDYISKKSELLSANKIKKFVVAEPNPAILTDMLTSNANIDVVMVYDRLKMRTALVSGNNVADIYVVNSSKELAAMKSALKVGNNINVITRRESSIFDEAQNKEHIFNVPFIEGYNSSTDAAKMAKYNKSLMVNGKRPLVALSDACMISKIKG